MVDLIMHVASPPATIVGGPVNAVLYNGVASVGTPRIGGPVLRAVRRLGRKPSVAAFDLLTVALSVTAADTFVSRHRHSDVGWGRNLHVVVPLVNPEPWAEVSLSLTKALGFLTGDRWSFEFSAGGVPAPTPMRRGSLTDLRGVNCISLFSGGLDSALGILQLVQDGAHPLLVSHAYRGDDAKQRLVRSRAFPDLPRFAANLRPYWPGSGGHDTTMRSRSFDFLALAAVGASVVPSDPVGRIPLYVPENGFIALNPPMTSRRIGSLSTRTTHPNYLRLVQEIFDGLGVAVTIKNPHEFDTKGEMVERWKAMPIFRAMAGGTVSCGKWKRRNQQCGRCLPCLIRRASFHAAGISDPTPSYERIQLIDVLASQDGEERGDLLAVMGAVDLLGTPVLSSRVGASGPLPADAAMRARYENVVSRGLIELRDFLTASGIQV
ncbi:MAG TPA: Qat anti-phage system QueC-like protein QatC [Acidocella sp.]|jgi:hypothetical protein|uniref:Qat anti-phage system QueC-like protein QatC n=1 Tax=Acidocella sp. TaxID=50710 RepID=UPI002BA1326C|nr:Qat anti-phage system QueC-like protein QatC [Acidocella sp.]HVE23101.1 Qat anti-phage system QueC-like protein QatC [Acidocella sp.]